MVIHEQFYRNIQMNEKFFLWIHIHFCLYITEYALFCETHNIYAFVKISGLIRKHQIFFSIDFHVDIDMKTIDANFLPFSHISLVKPLS